MNSYWFHQCAKMVCIWNLFLFTSCLEDIPMLGFWCFGFLYVILTPTPCYLCIFYNSSCFIWLHLGLWRLKWREALWNIQILFMYKKWFSCASHSFCIMLWRHWYAGYSCFGFLQDFFTKSVFLPSVICVFYHCLCFENDGIWGFGRLKRS